MKTNKISKVFQLSSAMIALTIYQSAMAQTEQTLAFSKQGTYEVPVSDQNLADAATFNLKKVRVRQTNDVLKVKYLIPIELTGEKNLFEFEGSFVNGQGTLQYNDQQMDCATDATQLMCTVAYKGLNLNQLKAENLLSRKFQGSELQKRLSVQKDFSTDPVGIIRIKLR